MASSYLRSRGGIVTVQSSKAKLACQESGRGPSLVLLHAGVADRRSWSTTMTELESTSRLVAYDRRGFGDTEYLPESYSHTDDLAAVFEYVGDEQVVLVGNSQGGRISIDFALAQPTKVSGLILIGSAISGAPIFDEDLLTPEVVEIDQAAEDAYGRGDLAEANRLEAHLWLDGPLAPEGRVGGETRVLFLAMNGLALRAPSTGDETEPPSAFERLEELEMPTLVVVGELDMPLMIDHAKLIVDRVPNARLEVMKGTAHLPQLEEPQAFGALVGAFLGEL